MLHRAIMALLVLTAVVALAIPREAAAESNTSQEANPVLAIGLPCPPFCDPRDWADFINPFEWLNDQIKDLYNSLLEFFEQVVVNPPRPADGDWQDQLFGNSWGLAGIIAMVVAIVAGWLAIIIRKGVRTFVDAFVTLIFITTAGALWFTFIQWLVGTGDEMTQAATLLYEPSGSNNSSNILVAVPGYTNIIGSMLGLGFIGFFGAILTGLMFIYEILIIVIEALGLIALAFYPLGEKARKMMGWIVSVGIVAILFGRPVAIVCMEVGQIGIDQGPYGGTPAGATFYIAGSIALAIAMQFVLFWVMNKAYTYATVEGRVRSDSTVSGKVETSQRNTQRVRLENNLAHMAAFVSMWDRKKSHRPEPTNPAAAEAARSRARTMDASRARTPNPSTASRAGSAAVQTVATKVNPATAAATTLAGNVVKRRTTKKRGG